jgi:hypothetical protein
MALKLKSLIVEQTERADLTALTNILKQQQEIFTEAMNKLQSVEYSTIPTDAATMLSDNAKVLCEAYIEYCENTLSTAKQYAEESVETIVDENASTMYERLKNGLTY